MNVDLQHISRGTQGKDPLGGDAKFTYNTEKE